MVRLFDLQIIHGDFYKALSQGYTVGREAEGKRGEIYFKDGEPLAINMDWELVYASPIEIEDKEGTANALAEALGLEKGVVLEQISQDNSYEAIKKKISKEESEKIESLDLAGVYLASESGRYYPQEDFASQLTGFVGAEGYGQYGLEGYYDNFLQPDQEDQGDKLTLTIDYSIQFKAESLLKEAKDNLNIDSGQIIVADPSSGKILAMANYPNFNPNSYSQTDDFGVFQNALTQKFFEPGSVFKPITMAIGIEEGKINPKTTYKDTGMVVVGGWPIYNYDHRVYSGDVTMTEVLEKSINTGAVFAESQIGNDVFLDYVDDFGFFEATGIDIQEAYSENKELKKGYDVNFATAAFGQGIGITPIQLIKAYCAIANGGKLVAPYIVEKIEQGENVSIIEPETGMEVISQKTSSQVTGMMVSVVENGYSKAAKVSGYYVAGKTGTAQVPWSSLGVNEKGYSDKTWQSFIGFAPAFNPKFLILVKLDNPETKTAEYSAVPVFKKLAEYMLNYYQIPPDYE